MRLYHELQFALLSQAVSRQPEIEEVQIPSQGSFVEFVLDNVALGQVYLCILPRFLSNSHSTNAPYSC